MVQSSAMRSSRTFEKWVRIGAPDPREAAPTRDEVAAATSWPQKLKQRKQWWSLQPVVAPSVPPAGQTSSDHPVDRFISAKLSEQGLEPAKPANERTLIRRLSYALLGLPPTHEQIYAFLNDNSDDAFADLVDRLLESPHFGERWARHWMDLVRYADSHGSEGDPVIPHAYRYRDYLIRALNDDVPYDQLVREHIAGDLLENPRVNRELGINESQIGPAHLRFVFHGFAPTDPLDEKVRFTDDQINVISKTFLGMTVSCARCHDHKFDAISQTDYYALFGILASCRPALVDVNLPDRKEMHKERLVELKRGIRQRLAKLWQEELAADDHWLSLGFGSQGAAKHALRESFEDSWLMKPWLEVAQQISDGADFATAWQDQLDAWTIEQQELEDDAKIENSRRWDLTTADDYAEWFPDGNGLSSAPSRAGEFAVSLEGDRIIAAILPSGVHSRRLSTKHRAFLASPRFFLDDDYNVWLRIQGDDKATVRYSVENYPRDGTVYPYPDIESDDWHWRHFGVEYWRGDHIHLELYNGSGRAVADPRQ